MARTIHNDEARYRSAYFSTYPGYYASGDGALRDSDGFYQVTGRTDDVINTAGHRLSTSEIENIISKNKNVAEVAVIGADDQVKGAVPMVFVILKSMEEPKLSVADIKINLLDEVTSSIGKWALPSKIIICDVLPKTRSGKIMRRVLRNIANSSEEFGDVSVMADTDNLNHVIQRFKAEK